MSNNIIFYDGFHQYATVSELALRWSHAPNLQIGQGGRSLNPSVQMSGQYARDGLIKDLAPTQKIGIHFRMRCSSFGMTLPFICLGGSKTRGDITTAAASDTVITSNNVASDIISLSLPSSRILEVHSVIRGSAGKNALLVGQAAMPAMVSEQLYAVDMIIDLSATTAIVKVALDGVVVLDTTFDRDRIAPAAGYVTDMIEYVAFLGPHSTANIRPKFSDIVIYTPDENLTPLGPLAVDYVYGEGLARPITNTSGFIVPLGDSVIKPVVTSGSDIGPVYAARMIGRTLPGVTERPYDAKISIIDAADAELVSVETGRVDSMSPQFLEAPLTGVTQMSDLAGLRVKMESR